VADLASLAAPFAAVAVVALGIVVVVLWRRSAALAARLEAITRGEEGQSLEAVLDAHVDKVYTVAREVDTLAARTAILEAAERKALARVGLVRFNPFEDTGGNQSFALAVMDANGDGWITSSLHTRTATRVYAKGITGGKPEAQLSTEENEALRQAMGRGPGTGKGA
jgi:hypothetical protein